jgi:hypothetical protein
MISGRLELVYASYFEKLLYTHPAAIRPHTHLP